MGSSHEAGVTIIDEREGPSYEALDPSATLVGILPAAAAAQPDRPVFSIRSADGFSPISARAANDRVRAIAKGLIAAGVGPGQRVALMSTTRLEWMLFDLAILTAGGVTVPIYDTSSAEQVQWIVSDSEAVLLVVENETMASAARGVAAQMPSCNDILVINDGAEAALTQRGAGLDEAVLAERASGIDADSLATVIYTSGTTGRPKGCVLTHRNLRVNSLQSEIALGSALSDGDAGMMFLPLAHVLTKAYALFCLEHSIPLAFATGVANLAEEFPLAQPTVIAAVPRIFEKVYEGARHKAHQDGKGKIFDTAAQVAIDWSTQRTAGKVSFGTRIKHAVFDKLVYSKIRIAFGGHLRFAFSGGGPLGERLTHFFAGIGVDIYEGYGLTETSPLLTINSPGSWQPGTVGRVVAGTTVAIADDGEIIVKGPQVFGGYWANPTATDEVLRNGWFRTGDIGEFSDDGFLKITGRKKELIVTAAGKNVAPAPLEDRLRAHPLVSQALVIGDARPFVSALLALDPEALERWCTQRERPVPDGDTIVDDPELLAEMSAAVEAANASVSRAESIREFRILPRDLSIDNDELTPTLKVRRAVVERIYAETIDGIYRN